MSDARLLGPWVRATWQGWLLGIPLVVGLALLGEALGIGGAQVLVGLGMGLGVGGMQGRVIRRRIAASAPWFWSSVGGLALPFLVTDIAGAMGRGLPYSLPLSVAVGGLLAGTGQALVLRARVGDRAWLWVPASGLAWALSAAASGVADSWMRAHSLRGIGGALVYLGITASGGLILGLVTAWPLAWILAHLVHSQDATARH